MQKICANSGKSFEITDDDLRFYDRISPVINGKKYPVPPPTLSPEERMRRRLSFRNERVLYKRKCDLSGKSIISIHALDSTYPVYAKDVWWSDSWDPLSYGMDFNFSRPFFEQFLELKSKVPHIALITSPDAEENNCHYINFAGNSKNCYMTFDSDFNEDSLYTNVLKHSKCCMDCSYVHSSELCYECVDCTNSYRLLFSRDSASCSESAFLLSCVGCMHCAFSVNLVEKKYCIWNEQYSKEEYFRKLSEMDLSSPSSLEKWKQKFLKFSLKYPRKFAHLLKAENCSGDYLFNTKNCDSSFNCSHAEDLKYCDSLFGAKTCMDTSSFGEHAEEIFESGTVGINCYGISFSFACVDQSSDLMYCEECRQTNHCFACHGLRRYEYCIFNQQYSKEDYHRLKARIIELMMKTGEFGQYFPPSLSSFSYNESVAEEHFPLTEPAAQNMGYRWRKRREEEVPETTKQIPSDKIPEKISGIPDDILNWAIVCRESGKLYKIQKPELEFYRKMDLPIPRLHPDIRHERRMKMRNPRKLEERVCDRCGRLINTTYAAEMPEKIYCEKCYLSTVY